MASGLYLIRGYLMIFFIVSRGYFQGSEAQSSDPCLKGFTQIIPPKREWTQFNTLADVNGGSFLYPEFTCSGTLNSVIIPYSIELGLTGRQWESNLELTLTIWRKNVGGYYVPVGGDLLLRVEIDTNLGGYPPSIFRKQTNINIQKHDILLLTGRNYTYYYQSTYIRYIPALLTTFQVSGSDDSENVTLPMLQVDFQPTPEVGATMVTPSLPSICSSENTGALSTTSTTNQCGDSSTMIAALGALLGLLIFTVIGLLVIIAILAVKLRRNDRKYKGANIGAEVPVCEVAISSVTDTNEASNGLYYNTAVGTIKDIVASNEYQTVKKSVTPAHEESPYWQPGDTVNAIYEQIEHYAKIPPSAINKQQQLGEGEFGVVYKGQWKSTTGRTQTVALKTLKSTASNDERVKLLQEAAIMGQFTHPHIVTLYGVVKKVNEPILVLEFLHEGDLQEYLPKLKDNIRSPSQKAQLPSILLRFCQEIADGMRYLSQKGFIHRDLAARNVLLTADIKCKIADFGMSHDLEEDYYYKPKGGRIPVKWTAPEAIFYKRYTTKSDVWSYGMVMYEIWSLGHKPFEGYPVEEVITVLNSKKNQPPPPGCPRGIYALMVQCWEPDPKKRITFDNIVGKLCSGSGMILKWENRYNTSSPLCSALGAPLQHGQELYKDLQIKYNV